MTDDIDNTPSGRKSTMKGPKSTDSAPTDVNETNSEQPEVHSSESSATPQDPKAEKKEKKKAEKEEKKRKKKSSAVPPAPKFSNISGSSSSSPEKSNEDEIKPEEIRPEDMYTERRRTTFKGPMIQQDKEKKSEPEQPSQVPWSKSDVVIPDHNENEQKEKVVENPEPKDEKPEVPPIIETVDEKVVDLNPEPPVPEIPPVYEPVPENSGEQEGMQQNAKQPVSGEAETLKPMPEAHVDLNPKLEKKSEKELKRTRLLEEKERKKAEKLTKMLEKKKAAQAESRRAKLKKAVSEPEEPEEEQEDQSGKEHVERVSRFSLKQFVTAYKDKQSVLVRQAEIRRFQTALFPKVMAKKWQTPITPTLATPVQTIEFPEVPLYLKLGLFFFRGFYSKRTKNQKLEIALRKAKMPYSAIQYYSMISVIAIVMVFAGLIAIGAISILFGGLVWYAIPGLLGVIGLFVLVALNTPQSTANRRRKDIDSKLPMALAYIATMASADVPVETIMYELGKSYEYGEISKEAKAISASSRLFGNDIVSAMREESKYSPSLKFSEFLQGIISTVTSGGSLKDYFTLKAKQFQSELSTLLKANAESIGVLAESYVTVGVAFPLMLLVILGVFAALSSSGASIAVFLYLIVLLVIPIITFGFTFLVSSTVKEVNI
ncbi:MAG: type II secretion system F family protein [Candidatus Thermoplasmatota archaeon]|nr:type II secretion system F family protein [Candidatus Thermoplasmatota archaeon]